MTFDDRRAKARQLYDRSAALQRAGREREAEDIARLGLDQFGLDDPSVPEMITLLQHLAGVCGAAGRTGASEDLYRRAIEAAAHLSVTADDLHLGIEALTGFAANLRENGRFAEAELLLVETQRLAGPTLEPHALGVAALHQEIGVLYEVTGRADQAAFSFHQALAAVEAAAGSNNVETAELYHRLAALERRRGRYREAEWYARTARRIREDVLGQNDPTVAADCALLASVLARQAGYSEAEVLLGEALVTFESHFGGESHEAIAAAHELATVLSAQERFEEAEPLFRRALTARRKVLGPSHPEIAVTLHDWAVMADAAGNSEQARTLWAEAKNAISRTDGIQQ